MLNKKKCIYVNQKILFKYIINIIVFSSKQSNINYNKQNIPCKIL